MANWRCGPLSRVINTRLPTSQPSALLYWARIPERQYLTIHSILRDGSVVYRKDRPLEREDASVILPGTTESSPKLMTHRCGDRERHGIDQQFRARAAENTVRAVKDRRLYDTWAFAMAAIAACGAIFGPKSQFVGMTACGQAFGFPKHDWPLRSANPGKPPRLGWTPKQSGKRHSGNKKRASCVQTGEPAFPLGYLIV